MVDFDNNIIVPEDTKAEDGQIPAETEAEISVGSQEDIDLKNRLKEQDLQEIKREEDYVAEIQQINDESKQFNISIGRANQTLEKKSLASQADFIKAKYWGDYSDHTFDSLKKYDSPDDITDPFDKTLYSIKSGLVSLHEMIIGYTEITTNERKKLEDKAKQQAPSPNTSYYMYLEVFQKEHNKLKEINTKLRELKSAAEELMLYDFSDTKEGRELVNDIYDLDAGITGLQNGGLNPGNSEYENGKKVHRIKADKVAIDLNKIKRNKDKNYKYYNKVMDPPLFDHEPSPNDVMQGEIGDCYFVASLAAIAAQNPDVIKDMIRYNEDDNTVTVRFYAENQEPVYVTVDNTLPYVNINGVDSPLYAKGPNWVKFIEKAWAASGLHKTPDLDVDPYDRMKAIEKGEKKGTYKDISGGYLVYSLHNILGSNYIVDKTTKYIDIPQYSYIKKSYVDKLSTEDYEILKKQNELTKSVREYYYHSNKKSEDNNNVSNKTDVLNRRQKNDTLLNELKQLTQNRPSKKPILFPDKYTSEEEEFFQTFKDLHDAGSTITASILQKGSGEYDNMYAQYIGLPPKHAYTVENFIEKDGVKFVSVRNPHGKGGRVYTTDGVPVYSNNLKTPGLSIIELRDFMNTFSEIASVKLDKNRIDYLDYTKGDTLKKLYKDSLRSMCNKLADSESFFVKLRSSKEFNKLRVAATKMNDCLNKERVTEGDFKKAMKNLFDAATDYRDYRDKDSKVFNGDARVRSVNRYFAADLLCRMKETYEQNERAGYEDAKPIDIDEMQNQPIALGDNPSTARKACAEEMKKAAAEKTAVNDSEIKKKVDEHKEKNRLLAVIKAKKSQAMKLVSEPGQTKEKLIEGLASVICLDSIEQRAELFSLGVMQKMTSAESFQKNIDGLKSQIELISEAKENSQAELEKLIKRVVKDPCPSEAFNAVAKTLKIKSDALEKQNDIKQPDMTEMKNVHPK